MILYKKIFLLNEQISFSDYINALRKEYFANFVLTVDRIPSTQNYRVQIFFTAPLWKWGLANAFHEGVLLRECTIQPSKEERYFTLQASAKTINWLLATFYVILAFVLLIFALITMAVGDTLPLNNILIPIIVSIIFLAPSVSIYLRDKRLLDQVGSLGTIPKTG